jgi:hypothetical protein
MKDCSNQSVLQLKYYYSYNNMLGGNETIFNKGGDGTITGGGFSVGNILNKYGGVVTFNSTGGQKGGNVADMFQGLVVPFGLFSQHGGQKEKPNEYLQDDSDDDDVISDKLHDELLNLAKPSTKYMTRKKRNRVNTKKNTRKK